MKRIITAVILLCFVFLMSFTEYYFANKTYSDVSEFSEKYIGKEFGETAKKDFEKIYKRWDESRNILNMFFKHDIIEQINMEFLTLDCYINQDKKDSTELQIKKLKTRAECLMDEEYFSVSNIF